MNWRTPVAQAVYWVAGMLSKVKYPQQSYTLDWPSEDDDLVFHRAGRTWQSVGWTWDLLGLSERIDPAHWEHWALVWESGERCAWCGGVDREQLPVTLDEVAGNG